MLTHEGLHRITIDIEPVQPIDLLLAKFNHEQLFVLKNVNDHPFGFQHEAIWSSSPPRRMTVLELTKGLIVFNTTYAAINKKEEAWVYPSFSSGEGSFTLRCAFDFNIWAKAGLRLFLGLSHYQSAAFLWVYYVGQIYRPPFGNIFDTCQICLGHNEKQNKEIFNSYQQPNSVSLIKMIQLLSDSVWNHDTFRSSDLTVLQSLVRFDSGKSELPMLPPLTPELITKCQVASNKELSMVTKQLVEINL